MYAMYVLATATPQESDTVEKVFTYLVALGLGGIIIEALRGMIQKKKMRADYADIISQSAIRLLQPLERRIKELEDELEQCQEQCNKAMGEADHWQREAVLERNRFREGRNE